MKKPFQLIVNIREWKIVDMEGGVVNVGQTERKRIKHVERRGYAAPGHAPVSQANNDEEAVTGDDNSACW